MKTFACGDVIPGCGARFSAADHGVIDITPELVQAVRDRIVSI
jgi:predicted small metal-binding protein